MRSILIALLCLALNAPADNVSFRWVRPKIAFGGSDVMALVQVVPHAANRGMTVLLDSGGYYTSSYEQLDGDASPELRQVWFKSVPAGKYVIVAVLTRADGKSYRAEDTLCLRAPDTDCDEGK